MENTIGFSLDASRVAQINDLNRQLDELEKQVENLETLVQRLEGGEEPPPEKECGTLQEIFESLVLIDAKDPEGPVCTFDTGRGRIWILEDAGCGVFAVIRASSAEEAYELFLEHFVPVVEPADVVSEIFEDSSASEILKETIKSESLEQGQDISYDALAEGRFADFWSWIRSLQTFSDLGFVVRSDGKVGRLEASDPREHHVKLLTLQTVKDNRLKLIFGASDAS